MTETVYLLSQQLARRHDPQTSKAAAVRSGEFRDGHENNILRALGCVTNGATYREIAAMCNMEPVAVARRLKGMERKGLVRRERTYISMSGAVGHTTYVERDSMALWWAA